MSAVRSQQRWLARAVMLLVALALLAPTISRALHHLEAVNSPWNQVCSAPLIDSLPAGGHAAPTLEHCPLCALQAAPALPPAEPATLYLLPALAFPLPALFLRAPRPLFAWLTAQPRAPPLG